MAVTSLSYERMVEDALRGVLRKALQMTAAQGLPGSHHFYITFDTTHAGVRMPESLRALHPNEMTIVLQHQFWDLKVSDDEFEITLSFSGVSQRLKVPFAAVSAFADPHAKFGLQFHVEFEERAAADEDAAKAKELAKASPDEAAPTTLKEIRKPTVVPAAKTEAKPPLAGDAKIVTLDAFRKK
ncbi:MAG: hypothetical protein FJX59_15220 [Alphaproteobacteria bacterium]|nr:hypothetical protein [Alphaproteobacteria bacterium]